VHAPVLHVTSHWHELAQLTFLHAFMPVQVTLHRPPPHVTEPEQDCAVAQSIVHWVASVQSIDGHAPVPLHVMLHVLLEPHTTPLAHVPVLPHVIMQSMLSGHRTVAAQPAEQSMTQVPALHVPPAAAHCAASHAKLAFASPEPPSPVAPPPPPPPPVPPPACWKPMRPQPTIANATTRITRTLPSYHDVMAALLSRVIARRSPAAARDCRRGAAIQRARDDAPRRT